MLRDPALRALEARIRALEAWQDEWRVPLQTMLDLTMKGGGNVPVKTLSEVTAENRQKDRAALESMGSMVSEFAADVAKVTAASRQSGRRAAFSPRKRLSKRRSGGIRSH